MPDFIKSDEERFDSEFLVFLAGSAVASQMLLTIAMPTELKHIVLNTFIAMPNIDCSTKQPAIAKDPASQVGLGFDTPGNFSYKPKINSTFL